MEKRITASLLGIFSSFFTILAFLFLIQRFLPEVYLFSPVILPIFLILAGFSIELLNFILQSTNRTLSFAAFFRLLIIFCIATGLIFKFFFPDQNIVIGIISVFLQFTMTINVTFGFLHNFTLMEKIDEKLAADKSAENQNTMSFIEFLHDNNDLLAKSGRSLKSVMNSFLFVMVIETLFACILEISGIKPGFVPWLLVGISDLLNLAGYWYTSFLYKEHTFFSLSLPQIREYTKPQFRNRFFAPLIALIPAGLIALIPLRLDFSWFWKLLLGLSELFQLDEEETRRINEFLLQQSRQSFPDIVQQEAQSAPSNEALAQIVRKVFIVLAITALVVFLVSPLFSKKVRAFLKERKLFMTISSFFASVREFFAGLGKNEKKDYSRMTENQKAISRHFEELAKLAKKSAEKRKEISRLTRLFVQLTERGAESGTVYTKNLAPKEYLQILAEKTADFCNAEEELLKAGTLFEQSLYAKELLTKEQEAEYEEAVKTALKKLPAANTERQTE
ncbi:MAG: hypothetical protein MJ183_00545 [Treponemataceae bacterium]|nr:hypothetical protein [Treponemataceae bacterium]